MIVNANWASLKTFADENILIVAWVQVDDIYVVSARKSCLEVTARISITDPPNADQIDFEENYKNPGV